MQIYHYEAVNEAGNPKSGMMSAKDETRLEKKLIESGWWLISARVKAGVSKSSHAANERGGMMGHASRRSLIDFFTIMTASLEWACLYCSPWRLHRKNARMKNSKK